MSELEVVTPGPLATVQDLGRPGHSALGVGASGAADRRSLRLANRLVGNAEGAAALELTLGGLRARFEAPALIALAGASAEVSTGDHVFAMHAPARVEAGAELRVGPPETGVRTYLAVAGGIAVEPVLGSRATHTIARLGPPPLRAGDRLPIGAEHGPPPGVDVAPVAELPAEPRLRVLPGPRADWFTDAALDELGRAAWTVTSRSDRVGVRLEGPPLERGAQGELEPEAMVEGALQVPPDGQPVLFLADHPVTGGYPVIAIVVEDDIPLAAQARPGVRLRFRRAG
jgi:biotin-dependent carboxylase-like uncharacterized protein